MKFIVIGLGSFGGSLAEYLTRAGHEIIGIDNDMQKVERYRDRISHTICMDCTDKETMKGLPFKDTDATVVAIGEEQGSSIMTTATLKAIGAPNIISRAISTVHETVLSAIGIKVILRPEKESARRWAKKLAHKNMEETFDISKDYSIVEIKLPEKYEGKTVAEVGFRNNYNLAVLSTFQVKEEDSILGGKKIRKEVNGVARYDTLLKKGDLIVVYGKNNDIERFMKA